MATVRRLLGYAKAGARPASSTMLEIVGGAAVAVGVGMVYLPAGVIAGGLLAVGLGWLIGDTS